MSAEQPRLATDRADRLVGEVLAERYRIENKLGEGAMGAVYRATHVKVGRPFAVKVLHPRLLEDDKIVQRFDREAELAGRLHHPNVIGVVDVGETADGLRYMVMDFARGPDLSTLLSEAPMKPQRIIHLVRQLLDGLYHAHSVGLIHRDFKPENVIIEKDANDEEVPRIVDFGIAILREGGDSSDGPGRLTTNGLVLGTPHYMAPEQAVNDPIDHRIDLFALGIMIYELLCGKLPFDGNGVEIARANLLFDPPPIAQRVPHLEVDPLLEAFSRKLMAKKRDERPATAKAARELIDLIDRDRAAAAAALGVAESAASAQPRMTEPVAPARRHAADDPSTFPPPIREPAQAPPMAGALARAQTTARPGETAERPQTTDDIAPIERHRRRVFIGVGVGGLALVGVLGVSLLGGSSKSATPATQPVVAAAAPPVAPAPAPPPTTPAAVTTPVTPPTTTMPAAAPLTPPTTTMSAAAPLTPPPTPVTPPKLALHGAKHHEKHETHVAVAEPVAPPTVAPTPAPSPTPPTTPTPPPATAPAGPYDNKAFYRQWLHVGSEIGAFIQSHPNVDISDLQTRYHTIVYDDAMAEANQAARNKARALLDQIQAALAKRK